MAGIYIHIPFCKKACNYCNFHFSVNQQRMPQMTEAIVSEALLRQGYLNEPVETIYFGGGTPSLLSGEQLNRILRGIRDFFTVSGNAEITLEANPDDISTASLESWKAAGINRLSIGIQSFFEADLSWMGRAHNAEQALACIPLAQATGFSNLSIDLIYGGPTLSDEHWKQNLKTAIELKVPHLSCYALTVEPRTILAKKINNRQLEEVDPDKQAIHFDILMNHTAAAGYEHYEISNFALPGMRSRHNSSYWSGSHYLGLGPGAHSYNGISRQWNIANNSLYLSSLKQKNIPAEIELLTTQQRVNEYIMTSLRTSEGLDLSQLEKTGPAGIVPDVLKLAKKFIENETLIHSGNFLVIPPKGKFYADGIAAELFQL
ncbi:MAG: radical SAM family heme chaperone HemW [Sediminibacterium sp.]|nr:radical SAM family heme chaperone HemW [Sediminibacterium sp.]